MTAYHTILTMLEAGPMKYQDIIAKTGWGRGVVDKVLAQLCDRKDIKRIARGTYQKLP